MKVNYQRLASFLATVALLWACTIVIFSILLWLFGLESYSFSYSFKEGFTSASSVRPAVNMENIGLFLLQIVKPLIMAYALLGLRITFLEASHNNALSQRAISGFKRFAWALFLILLISPFIDFTTLVIRAFTGPANLEGTFDFSFTEYFYEIFISLLLIFVAYVFTEGKRAKDENEQFL